jgi:hypothetical protein
VWKTTTLAYAVKVEKKRHKFSKDGQALGQNLNMISPKYEVVSYI